MKYNIFTNSLKNKKEIDKRSVGYKLKFKVLNWILMTFFKDWTIVKDIVVLDAKIIITKNISPTYGSNVILKGDEIIITFNQKEFNKEIKKNFTL